MISCGGSFYMTRLPSVITFFLVNTECDSLRKKNINIHTRHLINIIILG